MRYLSYTNMTIHASVTPQGPQTLSAVSYPQLSGLSELPPSSRLVIMQHSAPATVRHCTIVHDLGAQLGGSSCCSCWCGFLRFQAPIAPHHGPRRNKVPWQMLVLQPLKTFQMPCNGSATATRLFDMVVAVLCNGQASRSTIVNALEFLSIHNLELHNAQY